jgi:phage shock protein PspC (stress-responsive transcriptional regulator)
LLVNRRLYRCRHDRRIAGVASGLAEYFDLDVTLVRIVWFVSVFFGGFTLLLYIAMALIVPAEPLTADEQAAHAAGAIPAGHRHATGGPSRWPTFLGIVLVLFGLLALMDVAIPNMSWRYLWPLFIAGIGGLLIVGSVRRNESAPASVADIPAPPAAPANPTETTRE